MDISLLDKKHTSFREALLPSTPQAIQNTDEELFLYPDGTESLKLFSKEAVVKYIQDRDWQGFSLEINRYGIRTVR